MHGGALLPAPQPALSHERLVRRLCVFVCASVALHALTLVAYSPAGSGPRSQHPGDTAVLQAKLIPAPRDPAPNAPAAPEAVAASADSRAASAERDAARSAEDVPRTGGADIPLPEKWYPATELGALAQPLVMPSLRYPEELAGSGISAKVRIRLFVDERGTVRKIDIVEAGPEAAFNTAAVQAWQDVRFSPALREGIAVKSQKLLELDFQPGG